MIFCGNMGREITRNPNLDHIGSYFIKPRLQAVPLFQQSPLFESKIVTEKALMLAIKLVRFLDYTIFFLSDEVILKQMIQQMTKNLNIITHMCNSCVYHTLVYFSS